MSNQMRTFHDLINDGKIRIPKIQRDYAQGRQNQKVDEIRKHFIHTLMLVAKGKQPRAELDFVYGSDNDNAFEPLDGQQRLTTLFLLHWMLGIEMSDGKQSKFTYETRNTSTEFCDELVGHDAAQFIKEASVNRELNKAIENEKTDEEEKTDCPSGLIKERDWFKFEWRYDPTIQAMLVMIDAIYDELVADPGETDYSKYRENLNNITFNLLNLGDFGLSNDLYVKMNARGKQLSDFDKLKSTLEEELQIQQKENDEQGHPLTNQDIENRWRSLMDGAWIDFFWHKYARTTIQETESLPIETQKKVRLNAATLAESQFKKTILRLIALQLLENTNSTEALQEAAYNINEEKLDDLLYVYYDSVADIRKEARHGNIPSTSVLINYEQLINDINLLIFKDEDGLFKEISSLLPQRSHIENDDNTLFDSFLEDNVSNDVMLSFYAMILFLRAFPYEKEADWRFCKDIHRSWIKNLEDWNRSIRNILLIANNNQRIDKLYRATNAIQSLKKMIGDLKDYVAQEGLNLEEDKTVVKKFLKHISDVNPDLGSLSPYTGLDNRSLLEEISKAKLILCNAQWENCLDIAEQHEYLWGQIRCLLEWSHSDMDLFVDYRDRLIELLNYIKDNDWAYYVAILTFAPDCWQEKNRLFLYNKDRDYSFKRFLRDKGEHSCYGEHIKRLLDLWMTSYRDQPVDVFLRTLVHTRKNSAETWIQCIAEYPDIINESWYKCIFSQNGHVILARSKTENGHCIDPILVYINRVCASHGIENTKLYDSKDIPTHALVFETGNKYYTIRWHENNGMYAVETDDNLFDNTKPYSPSNLLAVVNEFLNS